jgi:hypothetical protein
MARLIVFTLSITAAAGALAQQAATPTGNWQSARGERYSWALHPVVTGSEVYLNIDVSNDGSFRGDWGRYSCSSSIGAYGTAAFDCSSRTSGRVTGKFAAGGQGVIELEKLGRTSFNWTMPSPIELAIDLPKNWTGGQPEYHRARMTRDGKPKPAAPKPDEGPLLSAPALYREFLKDEKGTLAKYRGRTLVLEGRRGALIQMTGGGAAIHIPDGFQPRALVLIFRSPNEVSGISEGATFRFSCAFDDWAYQYVHLNNCSVVR